MDKAVLKEEIARAIFAPLGPNRVKKKILFGQSAFINYAFRRKINDFKKWDSFAILIEKNKAKMPVNILSKRFAFTLKAS